MLIVPDEREKAKRFGSGEEGFDGGKVDSVLFEFGEDSVVSGEGKEVKFTDTSYNIVLSIYLCQLVEIMSLAEWNIYMV